MLRNWLISLLNRPRVPEETAKEVESEMSARTRSGSAAFQPIRSQEEIQAQEMEERTTTRRAVISRFFDDGRSEDNVKSRPSPPGDEAL